MLSGTFSVVIVLIAGVVLGLGAAWGFIRLRRTAEPKSEPEDTARPMLDALTRLEGQIRELELQRQHSAGGLEHHLTALSKETVALSRALRAPNTRGRWGELTLRR